MVAGLLRGFVASSGVFLLATTTVFPSMQRAGAAAPAAGQDYSATDLCPAELLVCTEDDVCFCCIGVTESSSTEFEACEAAGASSREASDICGEGRQSMCCIDELSEYDCMGNDVYVQYVACLLVESGCSADDLSCSNEDNGDNMSLGATQGGVGESSSSSGSSSNSNSNSSIASSSATLTFAFAFVLFAAGVSVGVMMSKTFMPNSRSFARIP